MKTLRAIAGADWATLPAYFALVAVLLLIGFKIVPRPRPTPAGGLPLPYHGRPPRPRGCRPFRCAVPKSMNFLLRFYANRR
jgi:hypothetical protein